MSGPRSFLGGVLSAALAVSGLAVVLVGASAPAADAASPTPVCDANGQCTVTFDYTGAVETWTVPVGVTSITATVEGAGTRVSGFSTVAGGGGRSSGTISVVPGSTVTALVGGRNGFGGGGAGGTGSYAGSSGSGGTFLAVAGVLKLVAGGQGGNGQTGFTLDRTAAAGGAGGGAGAPAADGGTNGTTPGRAATATAHGTGGGASGSGSFSYGPPLSVPIGGQGGAGAQDSCGNPCFAPTRGAGGGGGGGGYFAGGGAGGSGPDPFAPTSSGGGGGSGYAAPDVANVSGAAGVRDGDGRVVISYSQLIAQSISFTSTAPSSPALGSTYDVTATGGGSGNPVVFSVVGSPAGVCTISGSRVTFAHAGSCVISANQAGGNGYAAATTVSQTVPVPKMSQSYLPNPVNARYVVGGGTDIGVTAFGGSLVVSGEPLEVKLTADSASDGFCSVSGTTVSFLHYGSGPRSGSCIFTTQSPGNADYEPGKVWTATATFQRRSQVISGLVLPTSPRVGDTAVLAASGGASGQPVTYASSSSACTVSGGTVSFVHVGSCAVTASQAGDADSNAASDVTVSATVGQRLQSISFSLPSAARVGDSAVLSGTASAGGAVSYAAGGGAGVCRIVGSSVVYDHAGTCTVTASQAGSDDVAAAPEVSQTVVVGKGLQSISFVLPGPSSVGGSRNLGATGGASGQPVTFAVAAGTTNDACVIVSGRVEFRHAGSCVVTADQAGTDDYEPAATATQTVTVTKAAAGLYVAAPAAATVGESLVLVPRSDSPAPVSVTSDRPGVCSVDGLKVSFDHAGDCIVSLSQPETADYVAGSTGSGVITVRKAGQVITGFAPAASATVGDAPVDLSASGGGSGNPVTFAVSGETTNGACTISGATVSFVHAGSCVVTAEQAGNTDYTAAAQVKRTITVGRAAQAITGFSPGASGTVGDSVTLSASGGASGNPVVFAVSVLTTNGACTVAGSTVSLVHAGSCVLWADQSGNADYLAAPTLTRTITVGKVAQSITGYAGPSVFAVGDQVVLSGTGGGSSAPVVLSVDASTTNGACTLSGSRVTATHAGLCVIAADQDGDADRLRAPTKRWSVVVGKGAQAISFSLPSAGSLGDVVPLSATGGASGAAVGFAVGSGTSGAGTSSQACVISGGSVLLQHAGSCVVTADQAGTDDYTAAPQVAQTVSVGKGAQAISFSLAGSVVVGATTTASASGGPSGAPVVFAVGAGTTNGACTVSGATVSFVHAGTCVVTADQAATADYTAAATASQTVTVTPAAQTITGFALASSGVKGGSATLSGSGGASGNPVVFSIAKGTTNDACSISGSTLSFDHAGVCAVAADQAGNSDYTAASQVVRTVTVGKAAQVISGFSVPGSASIGSQVALAAVGGAGGAPVVFSVASGTTSAACTVSGTTVSFVHAGTCVVAADQAGTADYEAASQVVQAVAVARNPQSLVFSLPATGALGGSAPLVATGGGSGQSVVFSVDPSTTNAACVVDGAVVRFVHAGSCVVSAFQGGTADFEEARALATVSVERAATSTSVSVTSTQVRALVRSTDAGSGSVVGTPSGQVQFLVDGVLLGTAALSDAGVAVLDAVVPAGEHLVVARYLGDGDFAAGVGDYATSSGEVVRTDPVITATVTSARAISSSGWYRSPVTVSFVCTAGTGALVGACPSPVVVSRSTTGRTVTGTVLADDGGRATVTTEVLKVDLVKPKVRITGISAGHPRCVAKDRTSGVDSCRLKVRTHRDRVVYVAIAKDVAGNTTKVRKTVRR